MNAASNGFLDFFRIQGHLGRRQHQLLTYLIDGCFNSPVLSDCDLGMSIDCNLQAKKSSITLIGNPLRAFQ